MNNITNFKIRGFIDNHAIYNSEGNWQTSVYVGDTLICAFKGFGSEYLHYGNRYVVENIEGETHLRGEDDKLLSVYETKNVMPFMLKLRL